MIYTYEMLSEQCKSGVFDFVFTKVNGEVRELRGTRDPALIPSEKNSTETQTKTRTKSFCVYDLEIGAWRSMKPETVTSVSYVQLLP